MGFSENLRYLRRKRNYSQEYVAEKLGYKSYTTIQKWESGVSEPNLEKLHQLADLFNISMNDLVNEDLAKEDYKDNRIEVEVANYMGSIVKSDNELALRLISKLSKLDENELLLVEAIVDSYLDKKSKKD